MTDKKAFTACIEKDHSIVREITIEWPTDKHVPDLIYLEDGTPIICRGRYASPGERFMFHFATTHNLV